MIGAREIADTALDITVDTLRVLGNCLSPENAEQYCLSCGVPPFVPSSSLTAAFQDLEQHIEQPGADTAETAAKVQTLLEMLGEEAAHSDDVADFAGNAFLKVVLPVLVFLIPNRTSPKWLPGWLPSPHIVYFVVRVLALLNTRMSEAYPTTIDESIVDLLKEALEQAGVLTPEPDSGSGAPPGGEVRPDVLISLIASVVVLLVLGGPGWVRKGKGHRRAPFFHYGFDHPAITGLEETFDSAQHAFTAFLSFDDADLKQSDYAAFAPLGPPFQKRPLAISLVPVVRTAAHGGGLWYALDGRFTYTKQLDPNAKFVAELDAGGGALIAFEQPLEEDQVGTVGAKFDLTWDDPSYATWSSQQVPEGFSVRARRLALHLEAGGSAGVGSGLAGDVAGSARVEQAELVVGKLPLLDMLVPSGLRIAFDAGVVGSVRRRELHFEGGLATEVVIPLNLAAGPLTINTVTIRAAAEAAQGPTPSQPPAEPPADHSGYALRATGNVSLRIWGLTVQVDGVGGLLEVGTPPQLDGNVAGVLHTGWNPVWPTAVGLTLVCKRYGITGSGLLGFDEPNNRLFGGLAIEKPGSFSLKGIALCEKSPNGRHHWMVVGSLEWPRSGGAITVDGIGLLYGTNRHSDPKAFLDGLSAGVLDALVLPGDPVPKLPAYIGALNSLFPALPDDDGEVIGVIFKVGALGGKVKVAIGLIVDTGGSAGALKLYVILTVVATFPKPDMPLARVEAAGVAIWDAAHDEFNLRIVLRNSKLFGAELTGEAMAFYGDPERSGHDGNRTYLVSFGGFNPRFHVPSPNIYVPKPLRLSFARGDHLKIDWRLYVAFTPGVFHFGFSSELLLRGGGFGIHGLLALDLLITYDLTFIADITITVDLQLGGSTFAGLSFKGTLKGFWPAELAGRASCVLFWSWTSPPIVLTLGEGESEAEGVDLSPRIAAAVADAQSWDNGGSGSKLRPAERQGVWLSPSAALTFRQAIVPLERSVTRCGSASLSGPTVFTVEPQRPATAAWTSRSVDGEFAPGLYVDLSPEEGLSASSFVPMPAGFTFERPYAMGTAAEQSLDYELVVVDSANPRPPPHVPRPIVTFASEVTQASAECAPSVRDRARFSTLSPVRMGIDAFAVIDATLTPVVSSTDYLDAIGRAHTGGDTQLVIPAVEAGRATPSRTCRGCGRRTSATEG